jgi:hypothetical protein
VSNKEGATRKEAEAGGGVKYFLSKDRQLRSKAQQLQSSHCIQSSLTLAENTLAQEGGVSSSSFYFHFHFISFTLQPRGERGEGRGERVEVGAYSSNWCLGSSFTAVSAQSLARANPSISLSAPPGHAATVLYCTVRFRTVRLPSTAASRLPYPSPAPTPTPPPAENPRNFPPANGPIRH